jgi:hypothetical protein
MATAFQAYSRMFEKIERNSGLDGNALSQLLTDDMREIGLTPSEEEVASPEALTDLLVSRFDEKCIAKDFLLGRQLLASLAIAAFVLLAKKKKKKILLHRHRHRSFRHRPRLDGAARV